VLKSQTIPAKLYLSAGNRIPRGTSVRRQETRACRGHRNTLQVRVAGSNGRWTRLRAGVKRKRRPIGRRRILRVGGYATIAGIAPGSGCSSIANTWRFSAW